MVLIESNFFEANIIYNNVNTCKRTDVHKKVELGAVIGFGKKCRLDRDRTINSRKSNLKFRKIELQSLMTWQQFRLMATPTGDEDILQSEKINGTPHQAAMKQFTVWCKVTQFLLHK